MMMSHTSSDFRACYNRFEMIRLVAGIRGVNLSFEIASDAVKPADTYAQGPCRVGDLTIELPNVDARYNSRPEG